ncbi:3-oxo-tetronate kinase [Prosthecomicrobium sp. N25]|uniref:3-oxo-tetronate kinase n=1 Tax=Prosthecomicrobium sp. N25 TaxID=3129254 RepID=UPI0030785798
MSLVLGSVADDYTGASDLANSFAKAGLRTIQTIGVPDAGLALPEVDAVVVALKIRSVAAADAVAQARAADAWLRGQGAGHVLYKVCSTFDSTDAGNIGPITDALRADCGEPVVIVTPAFPETRRTLYRGHLFVGAVPLHESPLKDHPLNPMRDSNLVRVLARQSRAPVGLVDHETVAAGPDAVADRLAELASQGVGAAIADSIDLADLDTLGAVAIRQRLSVGASGLGLGIARALVAAGRVAGGAGALTLSPAGGPALCLAGSCSQATLGQIAEAETRMPVLRLDAEAAVSGQAADAAIAWAAARIGSGPVLIASSASPEAVAAVQARYGREEAGRAIEATMARIAEALVAGGVRRLVVAGGETSGAVVERLGIPAFRIGPEIAPGVPVLQALGIPGGPMTLALKSGNFGAPTFFADALALVQ